MPTIDEIKAEYWQRKIDREAAMQENETIYTRYTLMDDYIGAVYSTFPYMPELHRDSLIRKIERRMKVQESYGDSLYLRAIAERHNPAYIDTSSGLEIYYRNRYLAINGE